MAALGVVLCLGMALAVVPALTTRTEGAAIVGPITRVNPAPQAPTTLDQMKGQYRRPATITFPKDNPYTPAKAALGKKLFFDTRLSGANLLSCASCHNPAFSWGDGQPKGVGHGMNILDRRSPTIINLAFGKSFMWDGRSATLEEQALGPI